MLAFPPTVTRLSPQSRNTSIPVSFVGLNLQETQNKIDNLAQITFYPPSSNQAPINTGFEVLPLENDPAINNAYKQLLIHPKDNVPFFCDLLRFSDGRRYDSGAQSFFYPDFGDDLECKKSQNQILLIHGLLQKDRRNNFELMKRLINEANKDQKIKLRNRIKALRPIHVFFKVTHRSCKDTIDNTIKKINPTLQQNEYKVLKDILGSSLYNETFDEITDFNPIPASLLQQLEARLNAMKNNEQYTFYTKDDNWPFDKVRVWCEEQSAEVIDELLNQCFSNREPRFGTLSQKIAKKEPIDGIDQEIITSLQKAILNKSTPRNLVELEEQIKKYEKLKANFVTAGGNEKKIRRENERITPPIMENVNRLNQKL
ncbi:MAG: hypothetical protein VW397_06205 [Candidatus Margulisiibacteriota bacterium]